MDDTDPDHLCHSDDERSESRYCTDMLAWKCWEKEARALLDVQREPTEAMADAGGAAFLDATIAHEHGDKTNRPFVRFWRAMIDAARRERPANAPEAPKGTRGTD